MISAKDDEPQWVKDYYRKSVVRGLSLTFVGSGLWFIGDKFFSQSVFLGIFILGGLVPIVVFGLWIRRAYPPVRAWKEAWLKEHQIRTKEDGQRK
jgi:hypothetical protein